MAITLPQRLDSGTPTEPDETDVGGDHGAHLVESTTTFDGGASRQRRLGGRHSATAAGALTLAIVMFAAVMLTATISPAQICLHGPTESPDQRLRRNAAIRFVQQVNDAQERLRVQNRKFGRLDELSVGASAPAGFVPRLTADDWSYSIVLKDLFDDCGFMIFSDQDGVIYEGHPVAAAGRLVTAKTLGSETVRPKAPTVNRAIPCHLTKESWVSR